MLSYQSLQQQEEGGIAIIGLGGAGANILQCFGKSSAPHVQLYTMSLDERLGRDCGNVNFVQLGKNFNRGLGSGGDPEVGRIAAEESAAQISEMLQGVRLLVLVAGLGGGTGSGAAPVVARMAREAGIFLVSVSIMPFSFEGKRRCDQAEKSMAAIASQSDIVFNFENDYMESLFSEVSGASAVFAKTDRLMARAAASIPMLASSPGLINLGLDELSVVVKGKNPRCLFGSGSASGENRAQEAVRAALASPLISYRNAMSKARAMIVHVAGGESLTIAEIRRAVDTAHECTKESDVEIFFGTTIKESLGDDLRVTIISSIEKETLDLLTHPQPESLEADSAPLLEEYPVALETPMEEEQPYPEPEVKSPEPAETEFSAWEDTDAQTEAEYLNDEAQQDVEGDAVNSWDSAPQDDESSLETSSAMKALYAQVEQTRQAESSDHAFEEGNSWGALVEETPAPDFSQEALTPFPDEFQPQEPSPNTPSTQPQQEEDAPSPYAPKIPAMRRAMSHRSIEPGSLVQGDLLTILAKADPANQADASYDELEEEQRVSVSLAIPIEGEEASMVVSDDDDLDIPPSLRFNDLSNIMPPR